MNYLFFYYIDSASNCLSQNKLYVANRFNFINNFTDADKVIFTWFENKEGDDHCPKFMIFTDESSKSVVLAVRGTYSLSDVIVDVICDEEKFLDGYAHRGILKGANRIMKESGDILKEALAGDNYTLLILGASFIRYHKVLNLNMSHLETRLD